MGTTLYQTEPLLNFTNREVIKKYKEGLKLVDSYLGETYSLIINGERRKTAELYTSVNPSNHSEVI